MAKVYDRNDLFWSHRGDFVVGPDGDLFDTSYDVLRSVSQEVQTRVRSEQGDWDLYSEIGANLSDLVGEPNNKDTAEIGKSKIIASLTQHGLVNANDISIQYTPLDASTIMYRIRIKVSPTPENFNNESIKVDILYNYQDNNLHLI